MHVLVAGASGFVGGHLVPALRAAGHDVRALVRDPTRYDPPEGVDVVEGDLLDPAGLAGAVDGVEAAYYLVHSLRAHADFEVRDRTAARNFADAASAAGVGRVIYLGGLGASGPHRSPHLRSRREVEAVLGTGSYDLTTLRAAMVLGAGSASFELVRQLAARLPVLPTPSWVRTPCQPIAVDDVVAYLVGVLDHPETAGATYEIGGPEVLTYGQILRRTAALMGRRLETVPGPFLTTGLSTLVVDALTDVDRPLAHALIAGLRTPVVADDDAIREVLPVELTPFDEAVRAALADEPR